MRELGNEDRREVGRHLHNRAENSHQPFRRRERTMPRFRQMKSLQKFASVRASISNHSNRSATSLTARHARPSARSLWPSGRALPDIQTLQTSCAWRRRGRIRLTAPSNDYPVMRRIIANGDSSRPDLIERDIFLGGCRVRQSRKTSSPRIGSKNLQQVSKLH